MIRGMSNKFNNLIDDLLSTSNVLGASQVGIEDTAGNMSAANVEGRTCRDIHGHAFSKKSC